jgi:ligand-binding SRPBCC domain-containing protein
MPNFDYTFAVNASQAAVADFHYGSNVKTLTPFPIISQLHHHEPLGEGSRSSFTLWFGPLPLHWKVVHSDVDQNGFTDTQIRGPLKQWQHVHSFIAVDDNTTRVSEHIEYEYRSGLSGLLNRLMFSGLALTMLFTARKMITRRHLVNYPARLADPATRCPSHPGRAKCRRPHCPRPPGAPVPVTLFGDRHLKQVSPRRCLASDPARTNQ